jgi:hypothetical protein
MAVIFADRFTRSFFPISSGSEGIKVLIRTPFRAACEVRITPRRPSSASLSGGFVLATEVQELPGGSVESGFVNLDGAGHATGTTDQSSSDGSGLAQNKGLNSTYSISADGTGNFGMGTTAILISGNKLVFISNTSPSPTVTVVEK